MKSLEDYTDEELKSELKRRAYIKMKNTPRQTTYIEFEATVKSVENITNTCWSGKVSYKPITVWRYNVEDWTTHVDIKYHNTFYLKQGVFKKDTAPKEGDRVKIRYRRTKSNHEILDIANAKIVEIINK